MEKITALYEKHKVAGGKMVSFAGYMLPIEYQSGLIDEHAAVRNAAGLFDVSHMGEFAFDGPGALASLNHLLTNSFDNLKTGKVRYSVMCNENGGCIDDLIVYRFAEESFMAVVNAANREKDFTHIQANLLPETELRDISDSLSLLALQGPKSADILLRLLPEKAIPMGYYSFINSVNIGGIDCLISRTGYTGELGYEIYTAWDNGPELWDLLLDSGEDLGLIPCGLGARDTLRLEASMPLYGHEMNESISPFEAGLNFAVKLNKHEFIGRDALLADAAPNRSRVGLKAISRGIIREFQDVYINDKQIGQTTSGTYLPTLKASYAMALISTEHAVTGTKLWVDVRGRKVEAEVVELPFYRRP